MNNTKQISKLKAISKEMDKLLLEGKYTERNRLAQEWRELYKSIDFGYSVGQEVEYLNGHWQRGKILEITNNEFKFQNIIVSAFLVRDPQERIEQLSLGL